MPPFSQAEIKTTYHRIEKGQTIWQLSKIYNVDLNKIIRVNRIKDVTDIKTGQLILIPETKERTDYKFKGASSDVFMWPLKGRVISRFGQGFNNMVNRGINIQPYDDFDVIAARRGTVVFYSDNFGVFGKTLIIDHGDGFSSVYARNAQVFVKAGDHVRQGTVIATAGCAGQDKNKYLHFQIRKGHIPQNPSFYLPH